MSIINAILIYIESIDTMIMMLVAMAVDFSKSAVPSCWHLSKHSMVNRIADIIQRPRSKIVE